MFISTICNMFDLMSHTVIIFNRGTMALKCVKKFFSQDQIYSKSFNYGFFFLLLFIDYIYAD